MKLPEQLQPLFYWAHKLSLGSIFTATVDASKTDREVVQIGTVIRYLRQPDVSKFLASWADELQCADELAKLSEAFITSPTIAANYPGMPSLKRAADQLTGGDLKGLPLIALTTRPITTHGNLEEIDTAWIESLRTWAFVKYVDAVFRGGRPSNYLLEVVHSLRLAIDKDEEWLALFARLRGQSTSFHGMTRDLGLAGKRLLDNPSNSVDRPQHRKVLSRLVHFCSGTEPEDQDKSSASEPGLFQRYLLQRPRNGADSALHHLPEWDATTANDPVDNVRHPAMPSAYSTKGGCGLLEVDASKTPPEQILNAKGAVLATAEDHQFLPYSWNRPSPRESLQLQAWIAQSHESDDVTLQILATFVEIAIRTSNSLDTVLPTHLSDTAGVNWTIDFTDWRLQRLPPRRYSGWKMTAVAAPWVTPLLSSSRVSLSPGAVRTLKTLAVDRPECKQLGQFWPPSVKETPATKFNSVCKQTAGLERIRSGMLAQMLEQHIFEATGDPVLSELLSSNQRTGLSGACAYSSYADSTILPILASAVPTSTPLAEESNICGLNAAGSELSPIEEAIRKACAEALDKVTQLSGRPADWLAHHNALACYVVVAMLAATAGRPVSSPFESLNDIDWELRSIYIEDKVSSRLHQGRLVPLPDWLISLIRDCYLPHLARLAALVTEIDPQFSAQLVATSQGQHSDLFPLFFLLRLEPHFRWFEVTEASLSALDIFSWPLPWNLMRHRLPTTLKRAGQDHECINGITGHGEHGTAAYGAFSMRVWKDDAEMLCQPLTDALMALQFEMPAPPTWYAAPIPQVSGTSRQSVTGSGTQFGSMGRSVRRQATHQKAIEQATCEIVHFVKGRPLDSLTPIDWEQLSQKMLLHGDGRPRTMGTIRYECLQRWITKNWVDTGIRPRLKRRYLPALEERSPFTADAIGCSRRVADALASAHGLTQAIQSSRTPLREALGLGIMLLLLESRVADPSVLKDLIQGKNYRLVLFLQRYHLEHSHGLDGVPDAPVRRYVISTTAAVLLARAKSASHALDIREWQGTDHIQTIWAPFALHEEQRKSFETSILAVAAHIQQANAIEFPGVVAGYQNGDFVSAALGHADWVRVTLGHAPNSLPSLTRKDMAEDSSLSKSVADRDVGHDESTLSVELDTTYVAWPDAFMKAPEEQVEGPPDIAGLQLRCFDFFEKIRTPLNEEAKSKTPSRKKLDSTLRTLISDNKGVVSRSCLLLAEWLRSLLGRKTKNGLIRISSLRRYFNALSVCFQSMAYDHDLLLCDEDDVTEFYSKVMEIRQTVRPGHSPGSITTALIPEVLESDSAGQGSQKTNDSPTRYRSQLLALQLLRDFHKLVRREFGVEDPDWSEINVADDLLSISPGLVTEAEYQCALQTLAPDPKDATREQLARAFILLTTYRFGLRGNESTGLFRSDWIDNQPKAIVVLVRGNRVRRLKTPAGQRQVPLLFLLTDHEQQVVDFWLASFQGITDLDGQGPLFADSESPGELMDELLLRRQVSEVIKQVTGNPELSLHHTRHSFVNRVLMLLMPAVGDLLPNATAPEQSSEARRLHARRLLLNTDSVTRRTLWAIARLVGHAHPSTTVLSYLHLLPEIALRYVNIPTSDKKVISKDLTQFCINLDELTFSDNYLRPAIVEPAHIEPLQATPDQALRFLLLCQRGIRKERAQLITRIPDDFAQRLVKGVETVDAILATRPHINQPAGGIFNLLGHISESRWSELIARSRNVVWSIDTESDQAIDFSELQIMVGGSRQILLWKPNHFHFFKKLVVHWTLGEQSYRIHTTQRKRDELLAMAIAADLHLGLPQQVIPDPHVAIHEEGRGRGSKLKSPPTSQQIDPVCMDDPFLMVGHRCGVTAQTHPASILRSSHELVLLVLVSLALWG